ncbi:MAG: PEP-CTERM sorting domain-containing protein [Armatimonadetes bacterium]|nr:PEP-CTERM sorting domain-containing protein [Armatimonadota bacterium]
MKRIAVLICASLLTLGLSVSVLAHSGPLVNGEPEWHEIDLPSLDPAIGTHDESQNNPSEWYKGWFFVNLTNSTGVAWQSITIRPGTNDLVAIVQGNGLEDEWGFVGNSVVANKPGTFAYSGSVGDGYRVYENGATGWLWSQAVFTFSTPLASGQKVGLKIYTDNSWYEGPYASSFCICLTPTPVPEPSSLLGLFGGVAALAGLVRRKW